MGSDQVTTVGLFHSPGMRRASATGPELVGRHDELSMLDQLARQAMAGRARIVVVEGVAGSGKSALVSEALRRSFPGTVALSARSAGVGAAPYLPVASAVRPLVGSDSIVNRLLDGGRLDGSVSDPDAGLDDLVIDFLVDAARQQMVVLVLEDLDRADSGSIRLVGEIGSRLGMDDERESVRLMAIITVRRVAAAQAADSLRRLVSNRFVHHIQLRALAEPEVLQVLTHRLASRPSRRLLREVIDTCHGVPGRIEQVLQELIAADGLSMTHGEVDLCVPHVHVSPSADDVGHARELLAPLDSVTTQLVITAALMGAGRPLEELRVALAMTIMDFEMHLDEALAAGCLIDHDDRIDFVDPATADAILHGIAPHRRRRRHAAIASNLRSAGIDGSPGRVILVAQHLEAAGSSGPEFHDLLEFGRRAGEIAMANGDYSASARHYEAAIEAANQAGRTTRGVTAELYLGAGLAQFRDHDGQAALLHLRAAVDHGRASGDVDVWGRAVTALATIASAHSNDSVGHDADLGPVREFLALAESASPDLRARVLQRVSQAEFAAFEFDAALATARAAVESAAGSDDEVLLGDVKFAHGLALLGTLQLDDALSALATSSRHAAAANDPWIKASAISRQPLVLWMRGDLAAASRSAEEAMEFDRATRNWSEWSLAAATAAGIALARGELGTAERLGADAELLHRRSDSGFTAVLLYPALACSRAWRGDMDGAHEALDTWAATGVFGSELVRPLLDAYEGERIAAEDLIGTGVGDDNMLGLILGALKVELGDATDDVRLVEQGFAAITIALERGVRWSPGWSFFLPRLAAVAAWRLGVSDPGALFDRALRLAAQSRAVGELARTRFDAAAYFGLKDPERAETLATKAAQAFAEHGLLAMMRWRRDPSTATLARVRPAVSLPQRAFFFSDVVDSTGLTHRIGEQQYTHEVLPAHNNIVRGCLRELDGIEFKHTGDGIAAWFGSALDAIVCGLEVQRRLARFNEHRLGEPLRVRVGLSFGEVILDADDQPQGLAIVRARRICDLASAEQVVVGDDIVRTIRSGQFEFRPFAEVTLKGFKERELLHVAAWAAGEQR